MNPPEIKENVIFDSNIWILGFTESHEAAKNLIRRHTRGEYTIYISAYIYDEVYQAFDRSLKGSAVDEAKQNFSQFIAGNDHIEGPSQQELKEMDIDRVRNLPENKMLGRILGVQTKDIPIVVFAWMHRQKSPEIFTLDRPFASFEPTEFNLFEISISTPFFNPQK